jgi:hypothetical protein
MSKFSVEGGTMSFPTLTLELAKADRKEYDLGIVEIMIGMINDGMSPVKLYNPNKNGTRVKFNTIKDQSEFEKAMIDLNKVVDDVNMLHGTDIKLKATPK